MEHRPKVGNSNPQLRDRLRAPRGRSVVYRRPHASTRQSAITTPSHTQLTDEALEHALSNLDKPPRAAGTKRPDLPRQSRSSVLKRSAVKKASKKYRPKKHRRPVMPSLITVLTVALFGFGTFTTVNSFKTDRSEKPTVKAIQSDPEKAAQDGLPNEDDPMEDLSTYQVAASLPKLLRIEKLNVYAPIRIVEIGINNQPEAPSSVFEVGWYQGSSKPGEKGVVVLNGHVSGPTKRGIFYNLSTLKTGDKIAVTLGNDNVVTYTVVDTKIYANDKVDMARIMKSDTPDKPGLNIITSPGRFNIRTNQYEPRIAVFAVQDI